MDELNKLGSFALLGDADPVPQSLFVAYPEQAKTLALLHEVSRELTSILDREELLRRVAERIKKIIERLHENMDASEEKLGKKEAGDDTQKIQDQIVKDIDELIKQHNQGGGGGGGGSVWAGSYGQVQTSARYW